LAPDVGRTLLILGGCALLLAGCGGSKHPSGRVYRLGPSARCLRSHGFAVSTKQKDVGFIAYSASGGGLRARKGRVDVIAAFGGGAIERHQIVLGVKRFARQSQIFAYRVGRANVLMMWAYPPSQEAKSALIACLATSVHR
jgi:hypothetical protein